MSHSRTGRNHRPADREAYRQRRSDLAEAVAARLDYGREADDLAVQIRALTAQLREARTPAERTRIEAEVRPLVTQRQWLAGVFLRAG